MTAPAPTPPYTSEDHAFRAYVRALSHSGVQGWDPIALRGVQWEDRCSNCGSTRWKEQDGVQRCQGFRCGRVRGSKPVGVLKGVFTMNPRRNSGSTRIERVAELGLAFKPLTIWERRAWWNYVVQGSYFSAFLVCRAHWPYRAAGWSRYQVQRLVDAGRERSRPVLLRKGLI